MELLSSPLLTTLAGGALVLVTTRLSERSRRVEARKQAWRGVLRRLYRASDDLDGARELPDSEERAKEIRLTLRDFRRALDEAYLLVESTEDLNAVDATASAYNDIERTPDGDRLTGALHLSIVHLADDVLGPMRVPITSVLAEVFAPMRSSRTGDRFGKG
ncbi:hypothetical protein [uncultured Pseudokineococcus sp.]|uniref:hypothetical protein n=1 Tax=uncultured Pseudokineococcus sp. TaxID=1642928 RepID=UPI0026041859|nr:hypothetical protein [uncultured Pseudokineococcus sp.]